MQSTLVVLLLLFVAPGCWAETLRIGDAAPDFALSTLQGNTVRLSEAVKMGTVVLIGLRGYPGYQCPLCNRQVQDLIRNAQGFADAGARVLMVYPGPSAGLQKRAQEFAADKSFPAGFDLLLDPDYAFTNRYGLRWDAPKETAYPATFVINRSRVVSFAKISDSHGGRTTAAEVLQILNRVPR